MLTMLLEVPKDQYDAAVKILAEKIRNGQVEGLTGLNQEQSLEAAKKLVVKGHLTWQQSVNITKFCTAESLTYDAVEGSIVGIGAAGISFAISTSIYYLNTKDAKGALRVGVAQAGKAFVQTATVCVITSQLHRLNGVKQLVEKINENMFSPSMQEFLRKGFGDINTSANAALRGTVVTSIAVIAVTTGPNLLKLVRGRMSMQKFAKNTAVATAGVGGGVAGGVIGGAVGSSMGPVGAIVGRFVGGMVGGAVAAKITQVVADSFLEEDRVRIMAVIIVQIEYWAKMFLLTAEELENLNVNLEKIITQSLVEKIHGARSRRAMANSAIKPIVISIVKQRPALTYDMDDVIDACAELAA